MSTENLLKNPLLLKVVLKNNTTQSYSTQNKKLLQISQFVLPQSFLSVPSISNILQKGYLKNIIFFHLR